MKTWHPGRMSDKGSILVISLLVLLLASALSVFLVNTGTIEMRIASNDKSYITAFYRADAGIAPGTRVLLDTLRNKQVGNYGALQWSPNVMDGKANLLNEIMGFQMTSEGSGFSFQAPAGTEGLTTEVMIKREATHPAATGVSAEFASGYEGIGYGSAGTVHLLYRIKSMGKGVSQVHSGVAVETVYRKILGVGDEKNP
jgi:Tfp pilus assembly protein PilX